MATPILLLVVIYLLYAIFNFRQPHGAALEGPAVRGDARIQTTWIVVTSALIVLAGRLRHRCSSCSDYGAGSGSGPTPLTVPERAQARGAGHRPAVGRSPTATRPTAASRRPHLVLPGRHRWSNCTSPRST